jgi:pimeloyl-ACP methyl ester carboxylesterase
MLQFVPKSVWSIGKRQAHGALPVEPGTEIVIQDTLARDLAGDSACEGEAEVLSQLTWRPRQFTATVHGPAEGDLSVRYPSPKPQGNPYWDTAELDWYFARDRTGNILTAPAVVVLDILQGGNLVSGFIARNLSCKGLHAFVLHMPQNGRRNKPGAVHDWSYFLECVKQGAADARRARDVVAALPSVEGGVSLQGTSLGGFVATLAGSIDGCFETTILALTGGDVFGILSKGKMDAARVRGHLRDAGMTDERLREALWKVEPLRVAHRMDAKKTWLFSARYDQVVPAQHGKMLAEAINLDWSHHRQLTGCHYTCAVNAHRFLEEMVRAVPRHSENAGVSRSV